MHTYLYLSLMPEALVASHLTPEAFGSYLATGSRKRSRGQALFFRLKEDYAQPLLQNLNVDPQLDRPDHSNPRHSAYLSIYRVLESIPIEALEQLYLVTDSGLVLGLNSDRFAPVDHPPFHLYQEFAPVTPRVVSRLNPRAFAKQITSSESHVALPALVFADLKLGSLAQDPDAADVDNLPYPNIDHLRDCLRELDTKKGKPTKTVIRFLSQEVLFRTLLNGFYVGKSDGEFRYFPLPSLAKLETEHYAWWRSALSTFGA